MKKIEINKKKFEYTLRRRRGAKSIKLAIYSDGNFVVTAPRWYPLYIINRFLGEKAEWIWEKLNGIDFVQVRQRKIFQHAEYEKSKNFALQLIRGRVEFFNQHYNFFYNRISVKNQKTCWGSASRKGNLNFNYKIIDLPEELGGYIVVHELCHLKELNHGRKFWELVGETVPDYAILRRRLRKFNV